MEQDFPRILYIHWKSEEAPGFAERFQHCHVTPLWSFDDLRRFVEIKPDALVISLRRLPSHGREVALWWTESKETQHSPVIFIGGSPEAIENVRSRLHASEFFEDEQQAEQWLLDHFLNLSEVRTQEA